MKKFHFGRKGLIAMTLAVTMIATSVTAFAVTVTSSPFDGIKYKHNDSFKNDVIVNVIDVSEFNYSIDWNKVKAAGVDAAIIRCGGSYFSENRDTLGPYDDSNFLVNIKNAKAAGLMVGVYWFSQAITEDEAKTEAQLAIDKVVESGVTLDLPIFMDYEYSSSQNSDGSITYSRIEKKLDNEGRSKVIEAWCDYVKSKGYEVGFYSDLGMHRKHINASTADKISTQYVDWVAQWQYDSNPNDGETIYENSYERPFRLWQYTESGSVNGIDSANVDCNFWYINPAPSTTQKKSIANCTIENNESYVPYIINTNHKPELIVKDGKTTLIEGKDYTIGYINNRNVGTAYAYIKGIGQYSDFNLKEFKIAEGTGTNPQDVKLQSADGKYNIDASYISGVNLDTSVSDFKKNVTVSKAYSYKVVTTSNFEKTTGKIGTGDKVVIYGTGNTKVGEVTIVVRGDATGDGLCELADLLKMRRQIMELDSNSGAVFSALEVSGNGTVGLEDLLAFRRHIMGLQEIH